VPSNFWEKFLARNFGYKFWPDKKCNFVCNFGTFFGPFLEHFLVHFMAHFLDHFWTICDYFLDHFGLYQTKNVILCVNLEHFLVHFWTIHGLFLDHFLDHFKWLDVGHNSAKILTKKFFDQTFSWKIKQKIWEKIFYPFSRKTVFYKKFLRPKFLQSFNHCWPTKFRTIFHKKCFRCPKFLTVKFSRAKNFDSQNLG